MSKLYFIAFMVTLIGVVSGYRWCNEVKNKLYTLNDKFELSWVMEDIRRYLVAAGYVNEANEVQRYSIIMQAAGETLQADEEKSKEYARQIAYYHTQNCDNISEEWKIRIQNRFLKAENKSQLISVLDDIVRFLDSHGQPRAADQARKDKKRVENFDNFSDAQNLVKFQFRLFY